MNVSNKCKPYKEFTHCQLGDPYIRVIHKRGEMNVSSLQKKAHNILERPASQILRCSSLACPRDVR